MSNPATTKSVFRFMMAWNDEREERWLAEQERSGWHLKTVRYFGYTFEKSAPGDVAYRLDLLPAARNDRQEYFSLFRDAGWEHVGSRGLWQVFRKPVVDGRVPEIYTDTESRVAKYRRLVLLAVAMLAMLVTQTAPRLSSRGLGATLARHPAILVIQVALMILFAYGAVRLTLLISRLKRGRPNTGGPSR